MFQEMYALSTHTKNMSKFLGFIDILRSRCALLDTRPGRDKVREIYGFLNYPLALCYAFCDSMNSIPAKPLPKGMLKCGGFSFYLPAHCHKPIPRKEIEKIELLQKMQQLPGKDNLRISTVGYQADSCLRKQMDGCLKELTP